MDRDAKKNFPRGENELVKDCWLRVLNHLTAKEITQSFALVCTEFRDMALDHTAKSFHFNYMKTSENSQGSQALRLANIRKRAIITQSLSKYIARRAETLEYLLGTVMDESMHIRLIQYGSLCQRLKVLNVKCGARFGRPLARIGSKVLNLSSSIEVLRTPDLELDNQLELSSDMRNLKALEIRIPDGDWAETSPSIYALMQVRAFACPDIGQPEASWQLCILENVQHLSLGLGQFKATTNTAFWMPLLMLPKLKQLFLVDLQEIGRNCSLLSHHQSLEFLHLRVCTCSDRVLSELLKIPQLCSLLIDELECSSSNPLVIPDHGLGNSKLQFLTINLASLRLKLDLGNLLLAPDLLSVNITIMVMALHKSQEKVQIASKLLRVCLRDLKYIICNPEILEAYGFCVDRDNCSAVLEIGDPKLWAVKSENIWSFPDRAMHAVMDKQ